MKIVIGIALFILSLGALSQNSPHKIRGYHKLVNKAELNICKNNFNKANTQYQRALKKTQTPFSLDLYNYLLVNLKMDSDTTLTNKLLRELVQRGYKLKYLKNRLNVDDFPGMQRLDTSIFNIPVSKCELSARMDSFVIKDQQVRKYVMDSISEYYNISGKDTLYEFDSLNCINLLKAIQNNFPDESKGFINSYPTGEPRYTLVLYHCNGWALHELYDGLFYQSIFAGQFAPEWYVHLFYERQGVDSITLEKYGVPIDYLSECNDRRSEVIKIWKTYSKKQLRRINKNRRKIFLERYQDYEIKTRYEFEHKIFFFTYNKHIAFC